VIFLSSRSIIALSYLDRFVVVLLYLVHYHIFVKFRLSNGTIWMDKLTEILCEIVYRIQVEIIFFKFIAELFVSLMKIMCASSSEVVQYILLVVKF